MLTRLTVIFTNRTALPVYYIVNQNYNITLSIYLSKQNLQQCSVNKTKCFQNVRTSLARCQKLARNSLTMEGMPCFDGMIMVVIDFSAVIQHILIIHTADCRPHVFH